MDHIKDATQSFSKNSVEQTAYFRAMGEKNNLNMDKYRHQVEQELQANKSDAKKGTYIINYHWNFLSDWLNNSFIDLS